MPIDRPDSRGFTQPAAMPSYDPANALRPERNVRQPVQQMTSQQQQQQSRETYQPQGWDNTRPGVGEQYQDRNQHRMTGDSATTGAYNDTKQSFAKPGQGEQYWNQVQGNFNGPTNAQSAYNKFAASSSDPALGAYYDRAKERTSESLSNSLAAMGQFGSSIGAGQMSDAMVGLDAERANREADFALRRNQALSQAGSTADSQNQGQWGLGGQMSGNAQELGMSRDVNRINAAQSADQSEISRFNAGSNAAFAAQDARRTRGQDAFHNQFDPALALAEMSGNAGADILANDAAYFDAIKAAEMGRYADAANAKVMADERRKDDDKHVVDMGTSIGSAAAGMPSGGGGVAKGKK